MMRHSTYRKFVVCPTGLPLARQMQVARHLTSCSECRELAVMRERQCAALRGFRRQNVPSEIQFHVLQQAHGRRSDRSWAISAWRAPRQLRGLLWKLGLVAVALGLISVNTPLGQVVAQDAGLQGPAQEFRGIGQPGPGWSGGVGGHWTCDADSVVLFHYDKLLQSPDDYRAPGTYFVPGRIGVAERQLVHPHWYVVHDDLTSSGSCYVATMDLEIGYNLEDGTVLRAFGRTKDQTWPLYGLPGPSDPGLHYGYP